MVLHKVWIFSEINCFQSQLSEPLSSVPIHVGPWGLTTRSGLTTGPILEIHFSFWNAQTNKKTRKYHTPKKIIKTSFRHHSVFDFLESSLPPLESFQYSFAWRDFIRKNIETRVSKQEKNPGTPLLKRVQNHLLNVYWRNHSFGDFSSVS